MSLSPEAKRWHEEYQESGNLLKDGVDAAFQAAYNVLEESGFYVSKTDAAESLVAAIFQYLMESVPTEEVA